ncbi:MAG: adenosylcobinamide-GDP ribazoletransferase [Bacteroides sp.]|nr:adenosylcobinamide-GDP ribazoletransferase [Bacteroides sp.]
MKRYFAALMFFTRLPLHRVVDVPAEYFKRVVELWPFVGWITGGFTALLLFASAAILPFTVAILIALAGRVILTGALHEDGLADFCDGFGGGTTRERVLAIMKDSHIGTYGVLGLILYFLIIVAIWSSIPLDVLCVVIIAGDSWSKFCAAQIIDFLPYARKAEEAKSGTIYDRFSVGSFLLAAVGGLLPCVLLPMEVFGAYLTPIVVVALLILLMKKRINGYTGDCCGATFLLCELSFYLTVSALWKLW